jgi:hypothetical protein
MIVHFDDKDYQFDIDEIDLTEAMYIQSNTGLTVAGMWQGFKDSDPQALRALYWLMLKQNGKTTDISKLNFKVIKFDVALVEAMTAEQEANPTEEPQTDEAPKTST